MQILKRHAPKRYDDPYVGVAMAVLHRAELDNDPFFDECVRERNADGDYWDHNHIAFWIGGRLYSEYRHQAIRN